ncbi:MAG: hypothetical protein PHG25_04380 [Candidatus Pacebacteria bacterium]|nr:hypothetical protein [Candidatus Paceibacterota bacterium]
MESKQQFIDINGKPSPAVLSSLLGISVQMVYQGRQDGKLPPNSDATYKECLNHYSNYWKTKSASKVSNVSEAALLQKIKLDTAKTESEWLNIKQKKMELLDVQQLAETFEPIFLHIRTRLVSISRKHPETQDTIDQALEELYHLGESMLSKATVELDSFIKDKMDEEPVELPEGCEDTPLNSFDDYVSSTEKFDDTLF